MSEVTVAFVDFWPKFNVFNNVLIDHIVASGYRPVVVGIEAQPQLVICSKFGKTKIAMQTSLPKLAYIGESITLEHPVFGYENLRRIISTTDLDHPLVHFYPWGCNYHDIQKLYKPVTCDTVFDIEKAKTRFCCFVVSNGQCLVRNEIFLQLGKYRNVDSAGSALNNMPDGIRAPGAIDDSIGHGENLDFINWLRQYKFVICCENQATPGYHTEKITNAYLANTVPIYWGASTIDRLHNLDSMVYFHGLADIQRAVQRVIELDNHGGLYRSMLLANPFKIPLDCIDSPYNYARHTRAIGEVLKGILHSAAISSPETRTPPR